MTAGKENEEFSDIMQEIQLPDWIKLYKQTQIIWHDAH
jgi:hypothetical protein